MVHWVYNGVRRKEPRATSRAFVKEDASSEEVIIPARAPLPAGTPNHVTPRGMALLEAELAELTADQARLQRGDEDEAQRARKLAAVGGRIDELRDRLASALLVDPSEAPAGEVRFGATVTVRTLSGTFAGEESQFTIVGVDEAEAAAGRVAFVAPIAQALLNLKIGEQVTLRTGRNEQLLEVVASPTRPKAAQARQPPAPP